MAILSMKARRKAIDYGLTALVALIAWTVEITVLNRFAFQGTICNLPLTLTILWGYVMGSNMPAITPDELRTKSTGEIFAFQLLGGSTAGFLFGAFVAALYASVLPFYPLCYPIIGWAAGYFAARHFNKETLLCIPLTLLATAMAEAMMAWQLSLSARPFVFQHLSQIILPEALLNSLIAPFIYFPLRHWHEFLSDT